MNIETIEKYESSLETFNVIPPTFEELDCALDNVIDFGEEMLKLHDVTFQLYRGTCGMEDLDKETSETLQYYCEYWGTFELGSLHVNFGTEHDRGHSLFNRLCEYRDKQFPDWEDQLDILAI